MKGSGKSCVDVIELDIIWQRSDQSNLTGFS